MNRLDELLKEYTKTFKRNFPIFALRSEQESKIIEIMEKCLKEKKPYIPQYKDNAVY